MEYKILEKNPYDIDKGKMLSDQGQVKVIKLENIIIKYGPSVNFSEAESMIFIKNNTNIPVPNILDIYVHNNENYIVMEYVEGNTLDEIWKDISKDIKESIFKQLKFYIYKLRELPSENYIGCINYKPCTDSLINGSGYFNSEDELNYEIIKRVKTVCKNNYINIYSRCLKTNHKIVFTHGDINPRNIIIKNNNIVSILDWEMSGWYPEYWEYVKTLSSVKWSSDWVIYAQNITENYDFEFIVDDNIRKLLFI